jgi:hypothetical protein
MTCKGQTMNNLTYFTVLNIYEGDSRSQKARTIIDTFYCTG